VRRDYDPRSQYFLLFVRTYKSTDAYRKKTSLGESSLDMSWEIRAGDDEDDDEDDWMNEEDETARELMERRGKEMWSDAEKPQCGYNKCLFRFVNALVEAKVKFKVFGGAAYVHYKCGNMSAVTESLSACRTHDVDLYLYDADENKKTFWKVFENLKAEYRFDNPEERQQIFDGHTAFMVKWKANVDDAEPVEHGIDVHYVGDEFKDSGGRKLWEDWDSLSSPDRHFVTRKQLCETLKVMVEGEASSMDGGNKGARRWMRYNELCPRSMGPVTAGALDTIDSGLSLANPYGGAPPKGVGLNKAGIREVSKRAAMKEMKKKGEKVAIKAGSLVADVLWGKKF
jgi:hypothetical protein